jgi:hypothetical protein
MIFLGLHSTRRVIFMTLKKVPGEATAPGSTFHVIVALTSVAALFSNLSPTFA